MLQLRPCAPLWHQQRCTPVGQRHTLLSARLSAGSGDDPAAGSEAAAGFSGASTPSNSSRQPVKTPAAVSGMFKSVRSRLEKLRKHGQAHHVHAWMHGLCHGHDGKHAPHAMVLLSTIQRPRSSQEAGRYCMHMLCTALAQPFTRSTCSPCYPLPCMARGTMRRSLQDFGIGKSGLKEGGLGLFVMAGAAAAVALVSWARSNALKVGTPYQITVELPLACGVTIGTPLRIRGVQVGQVLNVKPSLERVDVLCEVSKVWTWLGKCVKWVVRR